MSFIQRLGRIIPRRQARPARPVHIVTDSTADLPPSLANELQITVVPLHVVFGQESFRDGIELTSDAFFARLSTVQELPRTSQPSAGEFQRVYEEIAAQTDRILSIHLSSKFSGTIESARTAAREVAGRCSVEIIDSGSVSMAMGLAAVAGARAATEGSDLDACAERVRSVLRRQRIAVALDSLEFLRRGGRIGRAQALLGGLLRLKPILTIREGEAFPLARVRTRQKALEEVLRICLLDDAIEEAAVMHATTPEDAGHIAEEVGKRRPGTPVHVGRFGPVLGVHGGPGMLGLAVVLRDEPASPRP
jgi:DegV family protein with EDD domain